MASGAVRGRDRAVGRQLVERLLGPGPLSRVELLGLAVLLTAVVVASLAVAAVASPLGHDEAVYALKARSWLEGTPDTGWSAHRAPLLALLALPAVAVSSDEMVLRSVGIVLGAVAVAGVWALARAVAGPFAGLLAAGVFAFAVPVVEHGALLLTDLPAAGLVVWAAAVCYHHLAVRDRPGPGLLAVAPLAVAALELRYGSALPLALVLGAALLLWWPVVAGHRRLAAGVAGLTALLGLPHAATAVAEFGTPWGWVAHTSGLVAPDDRLAGLVEYARLLPAELAGRPAAALMAAGVVGGIAAAGLALARRRFDLVRPWAFVLVPAAAHMVVMGLAAPPEARFVLVTVALGCVAGAATAARALRALAVSSAAGATAAGVLVVAAGVAVAAVALHAVREERWTRDRGADNVAVVVAAAEEARARGGPACAVLTSYGPQVTWYSGCATFTFEQVDGLDGHDRFALLVAGGKRQPDADERTQLLAGADGPVAVFDARGNVLGDAALYRLPDGP